MNNVQVTLSCSLILAAVIFITGDNPLLWIMITLITLGAILSENVIKNEKRGR